MDGAPKSYSDPFWTDLAAGAEQRYGLPPGLLVAVLTKGEKSNADQVSEAGAKTPFQVTPTTRDLVLKRDGIDAYLNPRNAADAAALVLKDGMQWAQGRSKDPAEQAALAAGYYHAGGDPANWGPKTKAYVQRVTSALAPPEPQDQATPGQPRMQDGVALPPMAGASTFDKALQQMQAQQAPSQLKAIYDAYASGQMAPEEAAQYEADVRSGAMMLPRGASLKTAATGGPGVGGAVAGASSPIPAGVLQAYESGQMTPQEMADFEHDVRGGAWQLPQGVTPDALFGPAKTPKGVAERLVDSVTGHLRRTQTTDALPDWAGMPELNQLSMASAKTGLGTLLTNPQETVQVIQSNFPGVQVRQDRNGNFILRSSVDGQEYAIKPGFQVSDIPRAAAGMLAFTPAGRATTITGAGLAAAGTQAAIEASQAATGGEFNPGDVAAAGAMGAAVPAAGRVLDFAAAPARAAINRVMGRVEPAVAEAGGAAPAAVPAAAPPAISAGAPGMTVPPVPAAAAPAATLEGVTQTARAAAGGSKQATEQLAAAAAPNAETAAAAERLGISNYLQPDHVTTNDAYRQVAGVLKSNPTSQLALQEKEGLAQVAKRASDLIEEVGGTNDLSALDASVKARMQATHTELSAREDKLYQQLREKVGPTTDAPAANALAFAEQRAKELGGRQNLSPMEKDIIAKLSPKGGDDAAMLESLGPAARQQAMEQGVGAIRQPTYALLDDVRRDVGAAARAKGPFSDADTGLAKKYYSLLTQDQAAVADAAGATDIAQAARAATVARKGMEDDLAALFGKNLDQSLVPQVSGAMKSAAGGDASKLLAVLKATPDGMKQEVVASGMATVFRNAATRGEINFTGYAKWYENLQRNQQAYAAVMSNLPPPARQQLADLYRVSKGISDSLNARIKTGLRSSVLQELQGAPDTLALRLFDLAKHAGKGLAADAVGGHGAGLAMGLFSALKGNAKPNAVKAIDELLTSPEFQHLAATTGTPQQAEAVRRFAYSKAFTKFARAVGNPRELSNRERWVLQAMQARDNMN